jgi:hypothetical protein
MKHQSADPAAVQAEIHHLRSLSLDAARQRWRAMFGAVPPAGLTKDIIARMISFRIQEEAYGKLDRESVKLLNRLARGEKPNELNRWLKAGTVLVREYQGERHTVTVVPDGYVWQGATYASLSTIARAITGVAWSGPRFFGLRGTSKAGQTAQAGRSATTAARRRATRANNKIASSEAPQ